MNRGTSVATTMLMLPSEYMQQLSYHFLGMYCVFKPSTNKETKNPKTNKLTEYKYIIVLYIPLRQAQTNSNVSAVSEKPGTLLI